MSQEQTQEQKMPDVFLISPALLQQTIAYLGSKPYQEVAGLIQAFSKAQGVNATPPEAEAAAPQQPAENLEVVE